MRYSELTQRMAALPDSCSFYWKFKVALNPTYRIFLNFAKNFVLSCLSKVDNIKKNYRALFGLQVPKAVIKGVFSTTYCCYGNLLCHENNNNVLPNGLCGFLYHDCCIK